MPEVVQTVFDSALNLSRPDRARLAKALLESLEEQAPSPADQADIDAAWATEIDRRVREVENGEVELLDGEEIYRQLRAGSRG